MGVFQDELVPTLVEIGMLAEEDESPSSREDGTSGHQNDWDMAERSRITQIAAGSYHSLALGGTLTPIIIFQNFYLFLVYVVSSLVVLIASRPLRYKC